MNEKTPFHTLRWQDPALILLDQRLLPEREEYWSCKTCAQVAEAIHLMVVRGAPAIGIAAAYGVALAAIETSENDPKTFERKIKAHIEELAATRPTAVNLFWALDQMKQVLHAIASNPEFSAKWAQARLLEKAIALHEEDVLANRKMGQWGLSLFPPGNSVIRILTHCNAGALATAGYGTALGVIYAAKEAGKNLMVYADETRPFLQGSRLTAWELMKHDIPVTLLCDNMAGHLFKTQTIDFVIVGADRIAANGDTANKIGTYSLAILAREHKVPFYVAAPTSTLDLATPEGSKIPIEERAATEVTHLGTKALAPAGVRVFNPAFDVTPHALISAIITEKGIARFPFRDTLRVLKGKSHG